MPRGCKPWPRRKASALFDGICILIAGVLLLTPGFVTDTFGFLLLVPPLRQLIGAKVIMKLVQSGNIRTNFRGATYSSGGQGGPNGRGPNGAGGHGAGGHGGARPRGAGPIIDGDFEDVSPNDPSNDTDNSNDPGDNPETPRNLPPRDETR